MATAINWTYPDRRCMGSLVSVLNERLPCPYAIVSPFRNISVCFFQCQSADMKGFRAYVEILTGVSEVAIIFPCLPVKPVHPYLSNITQSRQSLASARSVPPLPDRDLP